MNKDLLLSREQYAEARKNYGPSPFTFEIENEKQALFYFGANHSRNPKNRQYLILKEYWKRFLRITEGKDKIILIEGKLRNVPKDEIWSKLDLSIDKLIDLYKRIIGKKFNKDESQNHLINPNKTETIINKLSTAHSDLRELNIVSEIEKYWKEEKSIFVVLGSGHLIIQKPALKNILK